MNERIKELAEQAGFVAWTDEDWKPLDAVIDWSSDYDKELEKFAELIVRECMSFVSEPGSDMNDTERGILAQIKQHFGVE